MRLQVDQRRLLAFVHIEKAAGTSFIHILRRNYFLRYLDSRPMVPNGRGAFTVADLRLARRINPFLACIGGHAVRPHSDLAELPYVQFVTLLREPIARYLSNYQYWRHSLGRSLSFEEFLQNTRLQNFQTRKIAGCEDVELAKRLLESRFLLVGAVEKFDEFLVLLAQASELPSFNVSYEKKNVAEKDTVNVDIWKEYGEAIRVRNRLDCELYEYWERELWPRYVASYKGDFASALADMKAINSRSRQSNSRTYLDYLYRKLYAEPLTSVVRRWNGLPMAGSYEYC